MCPPRCVDIFHSMTATVDNTPRSRRTCPTCLSTTSWTTSRRHFSRSRPNQCTPRLPLHVCRAQRRPTDSSRLPGSLCAHRDSTSCAHLWTPTLGPSAPREGGSQRAFGHRIHPMMSSSPRLLSPQSSNTSTRTRRSFPGVLLGRITLTSSATRRSTPSTRTAWPSPFFTGFRVTATMTPPPPANRVASFGSTSS